MEIPEANAENAVWILAELGALNWGLQEAFNYNLVTELLGSGSAGLAYMAIGVAGAVALGEKFELVDITGDN